MVSIIDNLNNIFDNLNNNAIETDITFYDKYLLVGDCTHSENTKHTGYCRNIHAKIEGNDIETYTIDEENECADKCNNNSECRAFSYNASNNECKLKNSYYNIQKNDVDNDDVVFTKNNVSGWNHMVSEGVRPEIIQCVEPIYDGTISDEYIKNCNDAALCMMQNKDLNVAIDRYNEQQQNAWALSNAMWRERKAEHDKRFLDWKNKEGEFHIWHTREQDLKNEIKRTSTCSSNSQCPSSWVGWERYQLVQADCSAAFGYRRSDCKRSAAQVEKELNELGYQDVRPVEDYNLIEREPTQSIDFQYMLKTPNEETVQCCENTLNINYGDATNVSQSCEQSIEQTEILVNTPTTEPSYTTTPPTTIPTTSTTSSIIISQTESEKNYIIIAIIVFILFFFICMVSFVSYFRSLGIK